MQKDIRRIGWIGLGRMGLPMVERLLKAGTSVQVWNRTRSKAEPLAERGATPVDRPSELRDADVLFTMVSTGADLEDVLFGANGVIGKGKGRAPKIVVDCSSIGVDTSAAVRAKVEALGAAYLAAPVSGNGKSVKAGKLSMVVSGPEQAFAAVKPYLTAIAPQGVAYVGEGELARICKIAHNVLLGVVTQNLVEMLLLTGRAGVPRHAFLEFINNSVLGSTFTRYKSPAFVNLDWTTTFTPELLRKDLDLGLAAGRELGIPMPVAAAAREALQAHFGAARLKPDPKAYLELDFAALLETGALAAGMELKPENRKVPTGLETSDKA
jgi:3-hydroxyisobutyrate dehydrogenase